MGDSTVPPFLQVAMQVALVVTQVCTSMWYIFANGTFEYIHPIVFASIRGLICTATLIPIALVVDRKYKYSDEKAHDGWMGTILSKIPQQKPMVLLAANGAALTINQVAFIAGLSFSGPNLSALFGPTGIIVTALISMILKNEDRSILKIFGIIISVSGTFGTIVITILSKEDGAINFSTSGLLGVLFLSTASLFGAIYNNLQTYIMSKHSVPPLSVSTLSCLFSSIFTTLISLFFFENCNFSEAPWQAWYAIVFAATFGASITWTIGTIACKYLKPTMVVIHGCTLPLWTAILSYFFLSSVITWYLAIGAVIIIIGVLIVAAAKWQENKSKLEAGTAACDKETISKSISDVELLIVGSTKAGADDEDSTNQIPEEAN